MSASRLFAFSCLSVASLWGWDNVYHYNNMLIGDRANGMGGAYTAVSDDPSGLYYNPAGTVYSGARNLSVSGNAYHITRTTYKNVIGGNNWVRSSSALLPNFFGFTQPLGPGRFGFSYAVTNSIMEDQDMVFDDTAFQSATGLESYTINLNNSVNTYKIGPSYAMELADWLAVGATLYLHSFGKETILNQVSVLQDGRTEWINNYAQTKEYGVEPILGVTITPMDKISLGFSARKTIVLTSDTHYYGTAHMNEMNGTVIRSVNDGIDTKREYPLNLRGGFAWFPGPSLLISGDLSWYSEEKDPLEDRTLESVLNWAVGTEWYFVPTWAMRLGFYSNNSNTPADVKTYGLEHLDYVGTSFSLSRFTRTSALTLGVNYAQASGKTQVYGTDAGIDPQDAESNSMTVFLSTSYLY